MFQTYSYLYMTDREGGKEGVEWGGGNIILWQKNHTNLQNTGQVMTSRDSCYSLAWIVVEDDDLTPLQFHAG